MNLLADLLVPPVLFEHGAQHQLLLLQLLPLLLIDHQPVLVDLLLLLLVEAPSTLLFLLSLCLLVFVEITTGSIILERYSPEYLLQFLHFRGCQLSLLLDLILLGVC